MFDLTEAAITAGEKLWRSLFEQLAVCESSDVWPGYCQGIALFDVPDMEDIVLSIDGEEVTV